MPDLRDFLSRFRPAGAPGAAAIGVPADRRRELEVEVGPVLALLAGTDAECGRIVAQARRDAGQLATGTSAEAAARQVMAAARDEAAAAVRDAERRAAEIRELTARRMPALVDRAVGTISRLQREEP